MSPPTMSPPPPGSSSCRWTRGGEGAAAPREPSSPCDRQVSPALRPGPLRRQTGKGASVTGRLTSRPQAADMTRSCWDRHPLIAFLPNLTLDDPDLMWRNLSSRHGAPEAIWSGPPGRPPTASLRSRPRSGRPAARPWPPTCPPVPQLPRLGLRLTAACSGAGRAQRVEPGHRAWHKAGAQRMSPVTLLPRSRAEEQEGHLCPPAAAGEPFPTVPTMPQGPRGPGFSWVETSAERAGCSRLQRQRHPHPGSAPPPP